MKKFTRREFMKLAGSSIAFSALGSTFPTLLRNEQLLEGIDKYEYIVVLMLENRSFDNMLGYLYQQGEIPAGQYYEGVAGRNFSNPVNITDTTYSVDSSYVYPGTAMTSPSPDPGEEYPHINTQLFNTIIPDSNKYRHVEHMQPPFNEPFPLPNPSMKGFVNDYIYYYKLFQGRYPTIDEFKVIMSCFPPSAIPVMSTLAKSFGVCDNWHCSVPSQTFCNRTFFNSSSSWGYVNNSPQQKWALNLAPTIFNRLQDANIPWKVYFDVLDVIPAVLLLHFFRLKDYLNNFCMMESFYSDVKNGTLPRYSFVEPRMHWFHNDEHPPDEGPNQDTNFPTPSNVLAGEQLLHNMYTAIKNSNSPTGNNYQNTLFIVTYDEHGGCFDHMPPKPVPSPYIINPYTHANENGFKFERSGLRVPTILISSYIAEKSIIHTSFEHTSVIKTLCERYGLPHLTDRDLLNPFSLNTNSVFNLSTPRTRENWPVTHPRQLPVDADKSFHTNKSIGGLAKNLCLVAKALAKLEGADPVSVGDGIEILQNAKAQLGLTFCS